MNLEKAIRNSWESAFRLEREGLEDWAKGVRLGIEAMKAIERDRNLGMPWRINLLPGETEE